MMYNFVWIVSSTMLIAFSICFQLEDTQSNRIMIEDEISSTYRRFYQFRAEQVEVPMTETYQFHVDILTANIDEQEAQEAERLCGGAGDVADNLEIDAVVQEPQDNDWNDRYLRHDAQRNTAPDDNPGDGSDDNDDDDWVPGNNNHGGPGGNDDNNNDDKVPAPAERRRRNGDDPGDGDPPPPGGGAANEDGDNHGDYSNRDIDVPIAFGPSPFVCDDECRLIRRALYLCAIHNQFHCQYFVQAGITTFANLSEYTGSKWRANQERYIKSRPFYAMTDFHVNSLTAISLWVKTKIIHGSFDDVSSLSIEDVRTLVLTEVCADVPHTAVKCPKLTKKEDYPMWKQQMYLYLESQLTEENLRFSYIVRPRALPSEYDNLRHELEFVIPNYFSTAASKRDSTLVYSIIYSSITDDTAKTCVQEKNTIKNGRLGWTNIEDLYEGKNNLESKIRELQNQINK